MDVLLAKAGQNDSNIICLFVPSGRASLFWYQCEIRSTATRIPVTKAALLVNAHHNVPLPLFFVLRLAIKVP
jgi:hypothetical protein